MPTLKGVRNLGYPPKAIKDLCEETGISKSDSVIDMGLMEEKVRHVLNDEAPRAMCVLDPLKVIISNYPEDKSEVLKAACHPQQEALGQRELPFSREIFIERDDFMENPVGKFFRLAPGKEVRLRSSYVIKCEEVIKNEKGEVIELHCSYDENTLGKKPEGRKVKGVIHWVDANSALPCDIKLFDRLFNVENPAASDDFVQQLNPHSLVELTGALVEPSMQNNEVGSVFQFERQGYFKLLNKAERFEFHRVVNLKDTWQK
jgi:glutaminyl-tRNA synthetase